MSLWVLIAAEPELPDVVCPPNAVLSVHSTPYHSYNFPGAWRWDGAANRDPGTGRGRKAGKEGRRLNWHDSSIHAALI